MPAYGSQDRPQTIKQAKAAFKARGPTAVSAAERRRLERGATLLERASKIKDQEQRKKDLWSKKKQDRGTEAPPLPKAAGFLGTQVRLDKFGYKSSQFHLGAFLKSARSPIATKEQAIAPEPWDDEAVDDDALLDIGIDHLHPVPDIEHARIDAQCGSAKEELDDKSSQSAEEDFGVWDDTLESSTQLARDLSEEKATLQKQSAKPPPLQFSSFGSADYDFSIQDLEELERQAMSQSSSNTTDLPILPEPRLDKDVDRERMPPPSLPHSIKPGASRQGQGKKRATEAAHGDITLAELESIAEEEIDLSQFPEG